MFAKDFFKNRLILALGLLTVLLAVANVFFIIIRVNFDRTKLIFRHWLISGNSQFYTADASYFYAFAVLAVVVLLISWLVSYKLYDSFKPAAYFTFLLADIVLTASILVSETLLRL